MKKRIMSLVLCLVLVISLLPVAALAVSEDDARTTIARLELQMTKEAVPKYDASTEIRPTLTLKRALKEGDTEVTDIPDGGVELLTETTGYFDWQEWDAESESWVSYSEKTFAMGKYRALCRVRLLNAGSDKFAERYKFDSKAGLSVIVYDESASPMTWETRSIVHEKSYSSAVLLSPVYTVASSTAEPLEGRIFFTSAMRTGEAVSVAVSGCNAPAGNMRYRWQRLNEEDGVWYNWSNESTSGGISAHDMGYATGTMRLIVTAEGYSGQLVSEERTVIPAAMKEEPVAPKLKFLPLDNDPYGRGVVRVTNPAESYQLQDYLLSENPMTQERLDAAPTMEEDPTDFYGRWTKYLHVNGKDLNSFLVRPDKHYYVYTRVAKRGGFLPGRIYTYTTIYTGNTEDQIYLTELNLGDYGASGTIYVPIGEQLKLALKKQEPDANQWNYIRLKAYESNPFITEAVPFSMVIDGNEYDNEFLVGAGALPYNITIKAGDTAGTGYLGAFYSSASGDYNLNYGKWKIVVYDPANITDYELANVPEFGDVTMNVGDIYTPAGITDKASLTKPAGALEDCTFEWYARVGTAPITNEPVFFANDPSLKNEFIRVDKATGEVTALKPHGADDEIYKQVALYAVKGSTKKQLAVYHVTVNANGTEPVLLVNPGSLTMSVGDVMSLTAQLIRGEGITDDFTWSSADTGVAAVSYTGNKAEVSAVAPGNTTIVVKVGEYASAVTVNVPVATYNLTTQVNGGHGTISASKTGLTPGSTETVIFTPDSGYEIDTVTVNGVETSVLSNVLDVAMDADKRVIVTYKASGSIGHDHSYGTEWKNDAANHWHECSCGAKAEQAAHTAGGWITDIAATATADGTKHKECTVCHYVMETGTIPATGTGDPSSGIGSTAYTVTVLDSKNGAVTSSHKTAAKGTTVTLTVSPDKGYALDGLTVLDKSGKEIKLTEKNGKYTFTMPASSVEVEVTFKAVKSGNPFVDVPSGAYYEDAVIWAVDKGVTSGTDATHFAPNGICTRAQAVTFLWRAAGSPAPKSMTMPFADVSKGSYYEQAVLWAVENGITKGTSDTTFSPNATCSRAQIVTFLWRSQKSPAAGSVNPFTDVSADAYYADAVLWAVKESVTSGTTATTFSPNADCTRAQIVTFIYRALAE